VVAHHRGLAPCIRSARRATACRSAPTRTDAVTSNASGTAREGPIHPQHADLRQHEPFACGIAAILDAATVDGQCDARVVVSSNRFQGVLRRALGEWTRAQVRAVVAHDGTTPSDADLVGKRGAVGRCRLFSCLPARAG
jgi:hypothetical protein